MPALELVAVASLILSAGAAVWIVRGFVSDYHLSPEDFAEQVDPRSVDAVELSELARFEKDLPPGSIVVVLAHTIEEPQEKLRAAVQDNFQQGIRYIFLVSQSKYNHSLEEFTEFFKAIYIIARRLPSTSGSNSHVKKLDFDQIFSILPLVGEWTSWPYVLYVEPNEKRQRVWVFRGNLRKEGIAEKYVQLGNIEAEAFMNAVKLAMKGADHELFKDGAAIDFASEKIVRLREAS